MRHYGDITKLSGYVLPPVDCITGGSPCQDLSVAGKRAGLDGERSGLFMEQARIVKEMRERDRTKGRAAEFIRPRYMVWENVPGALSSNGGADFQAVLTEIARIAEPDAPDVPMPEKKWPNAGCIYDELGRWSIAWRIHDAQFWGVPQRRKRIALVADFGGLSATEVLFERKGLSGDFEQGEPEGERTAGRTERSTGETEPPVIVFDKEMYNCGGKMGGEPQARFDSVAPTVRADSHPSGVCIPTIDKGEKGHGEPICIEMTSTKNTIVEDGISPTLTARMGTGGGDVPMITGATAPCNWDGSQVAPTLTKNNADGSQRMPDKDNFNCVLQRHTKATTIRRLTPLECTRLQGYPDGWLDIGDWTDTKGKTHKDSDTAKYKAIGNSIALPFWFWLLRRISAQYERPATLGSLFDGIGGFPLCWERCNGKGTAIWASEIEEFCIAVTKKHFPEEENNGSTEPLREVQANEMPGTVQTETGLSQGAAKEI